MEVAVGLWKAGLAAGISAGICGALVPALRRRWSARWRRAFWLLLAAVLLLPLTPLGPLADRLAGAWAPVVLTLPAVELVALPSGEIALWREGRRLFEAGEPAELLLSMEELTALAWLAGAALFLLLWLLWRALRRRRMLAGSRLPVENETLRAAEEVCRELGRREIPVRICPAVKAPAALGLVRPLVLLPEETGDEAALADAIRRQMGAYSAAGVLTRLLLFCLNLLYWFNPLVAFLRWRAGQDLREAAAGDGGRWGAVPLCCAGAVTLGLCCLFSLSMPRTRLLTQGELKTWEERLRGEDRGLISQLYTDAAGFCLPEAALGGGLARTPTAEEIAAAGNSPTAAISREDLKAWAESRLAAPFEELEESMLLWTWLPDQESWVSRGEIFPAEGPQVLSGILQGDRLTLDLGWERGQMGTEDTELVLEDGLALSHTNAQHRAAAEAAEELYQAALADAGAAAQGVRLPLTWGGTEGGFLRWLPRWRILTENGWRTEQGAEGFPQLIFRREGEGYRLETVLYTRQTQGLAWNQWVRYVLELGMELRLEEPWPRADYSLLQSLEAGEADWCQERSGVIRGYLLSWGDTLEDWETLEAAAAPSGALEGLEVVRAQGEGRQWTLLLGWSRQEVRGESAVLWQVVGSGWSGAEPEEAQQTVDRPERELLRQGNTAALADLIHGGGSWGDDQWSLYIPRSWTRSGQRWYPDAARLNVYLELQERGEDYSDGDFYTAFAETYPDVRTNYGWGGTAAWAIGTSGRGQVTESWLVRTGSGAWELTISYPAEDGWIGWLRLVAETFQTVESDAPLDLGEEPEGPLVVEQGEGELAGSWLVLYSFRAWRLEDLAAAWVRPDLWADLEEMPAEATATVEDWAGEIPGAQVFSAALSLTWTDEAGESRTEERALWLLVRTADGAVTGSCLMAGEEPFGSEAFLRQAEALLGETPERALSPSARLNPDTGLLESLY